MFKRILYVISDTLNEKRAVMELALQNDSSVLIAALVTTSRPERDRSDGASHRRRRLEDQGRDCWRRLYELEEEFKAAGIKSSVMAQQGALGGLGTMAHNTHADLIILTVAGLAAANYRLPPELLAELPCPLLVLDAT